MLGLLREEMPASPKPLIRRGIGKNLAGVPEAALPEVLRWRLKPKSISI